MLDYLREHLTTELKIGFLGFLIALFGVLFAFVSIELNLEWLAILSLVMVIFGIFVGFVCILFGWFGWGASAIRGSYQASKDLRAAFLRRVFRKKGSN